MKAGDIVQLKLSGRDQRKLVYGIYLGWEKGGKTRLLKVYCSKGVLRLRRKSVQQLPGGIHYDGDLTDKVAMNSYLKDLPGKLKRLGDVEKDRLEMTPESIQKQVNIRALWNSVVRSGGRTRQRGELDDLHEEGISESDLTAKDDYLFPEPVDSETIAQIHFHPKSLSKNQIKAVSEILSQCKERGMPYFTRGAGVDSFHVYTREVMKRIEEHIALLNRLKGRYVERVFERNRDKGGGGIDKEDGKGRDRRKRKRFGRRKVSKLLNEDPMDVKLEPEEKEAHDQLIRWSKEYFKSGGWKGVNGFGLGGTDITHLDNFSLKRYLEFFGWDLAGARVLETPSALLEFLLRMRAINWKETSEYLLNYKTASGEAPFSQSFPARVLNEADSLPNEPGEVGYESRVDLIDHECYTIDPLDAKDFDDAVGFREFVDPEDGVNKIELLVHIADVSYYLKPDHPMDDEARKRCTSVYLPTGVLPMLPAKLSENLCSLKAGVDRFAFSTKMLFNAESAELLDWSHFKSVIRVRENLSYDHVNEIIDRDPDSIFAAMSRFSDQLAERNQRLDIVTRERKIRFSEGGKDIEVMLKSPSPATRLIEQFMVSTNESVARTTHERGFPSAYRIHPLPDSPDIERWNEMCEALGFPDVKLDIDFASLNRISSLDKEETRGRRKSMKTDALLSMLHSGGTLTLGGFGGPSFGGDSRDVKKKKNIKDDTQSDEQGELHEDGIGEVRVLEGAEMPEKTGGKAGGKEAGEKDEDGVRKRFDETLVPMDPEDLKVVGEAYRKALDQIANRDESVRNLLYERILSTMPRAVYSVNNHGHFGLNSLCYTHFTSPIRRYPDVLVHRVLSLVIGNEDLDDEEKERIRDDLELMLEVCNDQSKAAEDLERTMIDVALATRASQDRDYRGKAHECIISGLTPNSCFLSIEGAAEGRIPLSRLSKYRLTLDESQSRIILGRYENEEMSEIEFHEMKKMITKGKQKDVIPGDRTNRGGREQEPNPDLESEIELYRLGQKVKCRIHSVELSRGLVDLSLSD